MRTSVRIRLDRLLANYRAVRSVCPRETEVAAVLKANAYGHGAATVAKALGGAGCRRFAVASIDEGVELRDAGIGGDIFVLSGFLPGLERTLADTDLIPFVYNEAQFAAWRREARRRNRRLPYHLTLDTGMTRLGVRLDDVWLERLAEADELDLVGVGTHLASAEDFADPLADQQLARFSAWRDELRSAGLAPVWAHFANSAAIAYRPLGDGNLVRAGLALYGYVNPARGRSCPSRLDLAPALEWTATVLDVRAVRPGDRIGYDGLFTADRDMRVAVLAVGYGDGLRRELTGGDVWLGGTRRSIIGRISMDLTVVDITANSRQPISPGDRATLLGDDIDAVELASRCNTIPYEILCGVAPRVARCYSKNE